MARKRKSSSAQAATGSGAGAAGKSRAQRKAPVARRAKSSTGRRVPVRVPAKARRAAQLRRAGDGGGDDSSEASGEASDSDAEEAPAAGAGADASDASDSGASNGSDEDEAEYSSEYGSSDLDESSGDEAGAGGGASKGDTAVAQAAYSTPAVTASSGVRGYGSWIKGQRLDENGVLKQYQPTGSELRMHVDDLSSDDEVRVSLYALVLHVPAHVRTLECRRQLLTRCRHTITTAGGQEHHRQRAVGVVQRLRPHWL